MSMSIILMISLIGLLLIGVPVAIALGLSALLAVWFGSDFDLIVVAQQIFVSLDSFPLMAVPFFILAGTLMEYSGISERLINLAKSLVGHIRGGLGIVVVLSSLLFGAIAGSGAATVAALGAILIPAMIREGYDRRFAGALQAISGELGVIIPPSIILILYGVSTGTSVGDLFIAGFFPGVMIALSLALAVYIFARKKGYKEGRKYSWKERLIAFKDSLLALAMPIVILGGIYGGYFTPTEASVVAVAIALIIGVFVYKKIKINQIVNIIGKSAVTSSIIMLIIANAGLFGWVLSREGIFQKVSSFLTDIAPNAFVFLLIVNLLLLFVGMFFEGAAAVIILAPLLTPAAVVYGIDPVHFGIIMVVNLAIGMCTPPLGVNLFISCEIAGIRLEEIVRGIIPFLLVMIAVLMLISFIPQISLFLVDLLR